MSLRTSAPEGTPAQRPGIRLNGGVAPELRTQPETFSESYLDLEQIDLPELSAMALARTPQLQSVLLSRARRARDYLGLLARARQDRRLRDVARLLSSSGGGMAYVVSDHHRV